MIDLVINLFMSTHHVLSKHHILKLQSPCLITWAINWHVSDAEFNLNAASSTAKQEETQSSIQAFLSPSCAANSMASCAPRRPLQAGKGRFPTEINPAWVKIYSSMQHPCVNGAWHIHKLLVSSARKRERSTAGRWGGRSWFYLSASAFQPDEMSCSQWWEMTTHIVTHSAFWWRCSA